MRPRVKNVATSYTLKDGVYKDIDYTPQNAIFSKIYLGAKMTLPVAIQLAPEALLKYVGKYEINPGFIAEVRLEKKDLWIMTPDGTRWKLLPESETKYFLEDREEEGLIFNKDEKGNVISMTSSWITARKLR